MFLALDEVTTEKPTFYKIVYQCILLYLDQEWEGKKHMRNSDDGSYNKAIGWR